MEETLTVHRLHVPSQLRKTLASTNVIESAFSIVRTGLRQRETMACRRSTRTLGEVRSLGGREAIPPGSGTQADNPTTSMVNPGVYAQPVNRESLLKVSLPTLDTFRTFAA
jgi:hypothetical protein